MTIGSIRTILLFMIFIMKYISRFLPQGEEEPVEDEKKTREEQLIDRFFPVL